MDLFNAVSIDIGFVFYKYSVFSQTYEQVLYKIGSGKIPCDTGDLWKF